MTVSPENAQILVMAAVVIAFLGGLGLYDRRRAARRRRGRSR